MLNHFITLTVTTNTCFGRPIVRETESRPLPKTKAIWLAGQEEVFQWLVFGLTLTSGVALTITSLLNPSMRWRQLRGSAGILQSITWLYRARVGEFATSVVNRLSSQQSFASSLQRWRDELVAGSDLQTTSMERKFES